MENKKIFDFIDKIAEHTKNKRLDWNRLFELLNTNDDNLRMLNLFIQKIKDNQNPLEDANISKEYSFYSTFNEGYIFLFRMKTNSFYNNTLYKIALQPSLNADVQELDIDDKDFEDDYQSELLRLKVLIESQINKFDEFVDSFFEEK